MSRSEKSIYLLTAVFMVVLAATSWLAGSKLQTDARNQSAGHVSTIVEISHRALQAWANGHQNVAELWADSVDVASFAELLLEASPSQSALLSDPAQTSAREYFVPILASRAYQGYFLIGRDGLNLSSTRDENVGAQNLVLSQRQFLENIWRGETTIGTPIRSDVLLPDKDGVLQSGQPTMFVGAPIRNDDGEIIAALTFRIDPTQRFTDILLGASIGESGEIYAFDAEGLLISESRFDDELRSIGLLDDDERAILNVALRDPGVDLVAGEDGALPVDQRPLTRMAAAAVAGNEGVDVDGYRDYRGVEVIGAWIWDEDLDLGVASELDVAEAYGVVRSNVLDIAALTGVAELSILGVGIGLARRRRRLVEFNEHLSALNIQLEIQVDELTIAREALQASGVQLEELVRSKDELIASVSHELRTPLTAMVGFAQILQSEAPRFSQDERDEMVRSIADEGADLTNIVEDLLAAARAEAGTLTLVRVPVDLRAQVAQVLESWGPEAARHVELTGSPVRAVGDPARVRQIVRNLVSNALRYGGDTIRVSVVSSDSTARVLVGDDGPGVEREQIERIFEPYQRAHDVPGLTGSMGLGLTISRQLARLMDGDLGYRRESGLTIFELSLPLEAALPMPPSEVGSPTSLSGRHLDKQQTSA